MKCTFSLIQQVFITGPEASMSARSLVEQKVCDKNKLVHSKGTCPCEEGACIHILGLL